MKSYENLYIHIFLLREHYMRYDNFQANAFIGNIVSCCKLFNTLGKQSQLIPAKTLLSWKQENCLKIFRQLNPGANSKRNATFQIKVSWSKLRNVYPSIMENYLFLETSRILMVRRRSLTLETGLKERLPGSSYLKTASISYSDSFSY